ncbi:MarR family winged helix-turn-helix transcriptional regulator [Cellvibrio sp. OA-2007]|uniref:MarR family winged helix-turn-helix transcriptional regulator n=1 Tax=Cellvibrio sp. OA-2007 TaxID=529823 RepID=UPI0009FE120B|nr:MarR family transcriptional regulator [Cellvibrio sp. OA-2007]
MSSSIATESVTEFIHELPALVPEQESLGFLLTDNLRLTRRIAARYFEQYNLTLAQARALLGVFRWQGIRQVDLADFMEIQPISLARLLDQLAESGLIERRPDPKDRRAFQLYLLPAAAPIITMINKATREYQQKALEGLSPEQVQVLFHGLNLMRENLTALSRNP